MRTSHRLQTRATALLLASGIAVSVAATQTAAATTEPPPTAPTDSASTVPDAASTATSTTAAAMVASTAATTAAPTTTPTTTAAPAVVERQPLTGVPISGDVSYTPRPALVVKIDNVGEARPQTGLNQADIVFEEIVEGRATRFAAVFNSMDSNPVGPIRSGRTQDVNLLSSFNDPIFAYSGGNEGVNAALAATGWTLLTQGNGMFRSGDRPAPHNLYGNTSDFYTMAGESGNATPQFEYVAPGQDVAGTPVSFVDVLVGHNQVRWEWSADQGLFLRSQQGGPHQLTDGQASANTVVVLLTGYGASAAASGSPEAVTTGSGQVVVYSNGRKIEGAWTRASNTEPFHLEAAGQPILIAPGRTWVELVDGANFTLEDG